MQLIKKELLRQMDLNVNSTQATLDKIFDNYKVAGELPTPATLDKIFDNYNVAGELPPPANQWSDIMLENIPEGIPKRNRTFQLFEELRDIDMQWGFLADPGPGVHKCCVHHG